jgi:hypothetical protein
LKEFLPFSETISILEVILYSENICIIGIEIRILLLDGDIEYKDGRKSKRDNEGCKF